MESTSFDIYYIIYCSVPYDILYNSNQKHIDENLKKFTDKLCYHQQLNHFQNMKEFLEKKQETISLFFTKSTTQS